MHIFEYSFRNNGFVNQIDIVFFTSYISTFKTLADGLQIFHQIFVYRN